MIAEIDTPSPLLLSSLTTQSQIQQLIQQYPHPVTTAHLGHSTHYRCVAKGWEIEVRQGKLDTFFAYFRTSKMAAWEGRLKGGVRAEWTLKGAVMVLGEPATKSSKMVELIYPQIGMGLVFQGTWNN